MLSHPCIRPRKNRTIRCIFKANHVEARASHGHKFLRRMVDALIGALATRENVAGARFVADYVPMHRKSRRKV